jgi:hypothetical protein
LGSIENAKKDISDPSDIRISEEEMCSEDILELLLNGGSDDKIEDIQITLIALLLTKCSIIKNAHFLYMEFFNLSVCR